MINKFKLISTLKMLGLFSLTLLTIQSCSNDTLADSDVVADEFGRGNDRNGRQDRDDDRQVLPLSNLDNDVLHSWTELYLDLERHATGRPNAAARAIAYVYLAAYETGNPAMENLSSNSARLGGLRLDRPQRRDEIDYELALNATMSDVLQHFLKGLSSDQYDSIEAFEEEQEQILSDGLSDRSVTNSIEWGEEVAEQIRRYSRTDRDAEEQILDPQPTSYEPAVAPGNWTYSADPERALFPYWESVRTFVVSPEETSTVPPLQYSSNPTSPYFAQMNEVLEVNDQAKAAQGDQLHIAEFWSDDVEGLMMSPPARQLSIANQLIEQYDMNLEESLVLFLKVGFALNDAAVAAWKYKYQYMVMRPSNYIHEFIDPDFQTNLYRLIYWPNPSFPGYPSGHSTFASAAGGVFIDTFGDATDFTDRTHEGRSEFLGSARTFSSFTQMADENGYSRIPLGVHPRMDCTEGLRLGYEIADAVNSLRLDQPN